MTTTAKVERNGDDGQFDDAIEDISVQRDVHTERPTISHIDEEHLLEWSEPEDDEEVYEEEEDDIEEDEYEDNRVEDEDWEIAERGECLSIRMKSVYTTSCWQTLRSNSIAYGSTSQYIQESLKDLNNQIQNLLA